MKTDQEIKALRKELARLIEAYLGIDANSCTVSYSENRGDQIDFDWQKYPESKVKELATRLQSAGVHAPFHSSEHGMSGWDYGINYDGQLEKDINALKSKLKERAGENNSFVLPAMQLHQQRDAEKYQIDEAFKSIPDEKRQKPTT